MASIPSAKSIIPGRTLRRSRRIQERLHRAATDAVPPSGLMKISLEIREMIYRMLLTTPYCTVIGSKRRLVRYRLDTAILLANKQISTEASRVLYQQNHFIVFKVNTVDIRGFEILTFQFFPQDKIRNPLLEVVLGSADDTFRFPNHTHTYVTTPTELQSIVNAIWDRAFITLGDGVELALGKGSLKISLHFNLKADARYENYSTLVLKPWEKIHGIKELKLSGDIKQPMAKHLTSRMLQGPFSNEIAASFEQYRMIAEGEYQRGDYNAARMAWAVLCGYFQYLYFLMPHHKQGGRLVERENEFWHALKMSLPFYMEGDLGLLKVGFRQSIYYLATDTVDSVAIWTDLKLRWFALADDFAYNTTHLAHVKISLCIALGSTAIGETELGMKGIKKLLGIYV